MNLRGDFEIGHAEFTKPAMQEKVNNLSRVAQGEKPDDAPESVFENMRGHVEMENASRERQRSLFRDSGRARAHARNVRC